MKYKNEVKCNSDFLAKAIMRTDPNLMKFLESVFTLIEGATDKKMTAKEISDSLSKLPLIALRSPIVLNLYSDLHNDSEPPMEEVELHDENDESIEPDDDAYNLPSCEFDTADDSSDEGVEFEPEYGNEDDYEPMSATEYVSDLNSDETTETSKDYKDGVAPFASLKKK